MIRTKAYQPDCIYYYVIIKNAKLINQLKKRMMIRFIYFFLKIFAVFHLAGYSFLCFYAFSHDLLSIGFLLFITIHFATAKKLSIIHQIIT